MIEKEAGKAEADCTSCVEKHGQTHPIHNWQVVLTNLRPSSQAYVPSQQKQHVDKNSLLSTVTDWFLFSFSEDRDWENSWLWVYLKLTELSFQAEGPEHILANEKGERKTYILRVCGYIWLEDEHEKSEKQKWHYFMEK